MKSLRNFMRLLRIYITPALYRSGEGAGCSKTRLPRKLGERAGRKFLYYQIFSIYFKNRDVNTFLRLTIRTKSVSK
jgi:hypothetical protein